MTTDLDAKGDFALLAEDRTRVVLCRRGGEETPIDGAVRFPAALRELSADQRGVKTGDGHYKPSFGQVVAGDAVWHLPQPAGIAAPRLGDVLRDARGERWTILGVESLDRTGRWRCLARNLAVAAGLDDYVDIERFDPAGGESGAWRTWRTGVRARIQPSSAKVLVRQQTRSTVQRFRIFLEEDLPIDHRHRIRGAGGRRYTVVAYQAAERIGELLQVEAEVIGPATW